MADREVPVPIIRKGGGGYPRPGRSVFLLSAAAHVALAAVLAGTGVFAPAVRGTIVVDLARPEEAGFPLPAAESRAGTPPVRKGPATDARNGETAPPPPAPRGRAPEPVPVIRPGTIPERPSRAIPPAEGIPPAASPIPRIADVRIPAVPAPAEGSSGAAPGTGTVLSGEALRADADELPGDGSPLASAPGNGSDRAAGFHFGGIRESIRRALVYPPTARRMGWQGEVLVTFVLLRDGRVSGLRILHSSGYPLLDRSALDAVRTAQPFDPRPPSESPIVAPVVYSLN